MRIKTLVIFLIAIAVPPAVLCSENFKYGHNNKRDPFRPLVDTAGNILPEVRPVSATVELNLEGIVWSGKGDSYAILGGSVVRAGDLLGGYKVKAIEKSKVILERGNEESVINLRSEEE